MTHKQCIAAYARGEAIDRLPGAPIIGNTATRALGIKVSDFRGNGKLITAGQVAVYLNEAGVCGRVRKIGWPVGAVEMESSCRA